MIEASTTRRPLRPSTAPTESTTAHGRQARPSGRRDGVTVDSEVARDHLGQRVIVDGIAGQASRRR